MFRLRNVVAVLAFLTLSSVLGAVEAPNVISLGGINVHGSRLMVKSKGGSKQEAAVDRSAVMVLIASAGMRVHREYTLVPGLMVLKEPEVRLETSTLLTPEIRRQRLLDRIQYLQASGLFEYVEPDMEQRVNAIPNDGKFADGTLWGLRNTGQQGGLAGVDVDATSAWNVTTGNKSVVVGVIDTGVRYTHKDLAENIWTNPGEIPGNGIDDDGNGYVDDVHGINAITGSGDPFDDNDHGSHVSGTIGAAVNNGFPHVGVAWHVSIMGLKFLSASGSGFNSDAIECLQYAVRMKVKVSNNSWGGGGESTALADALLAARAAGHLFVAAAGNNGSNNDSTFVSPASYLFDNIISVAAIDRKGKLADFSDFGAISVHIGAPGVEIYSSVSGSDTSYDIFQGTSMAAPHVTGVAALVLAQFPNASLLELRQRILNSAVPTPSLVGKTATGGRVSAFKAVFGGDVENILKISVNPPDKSQLLVGTNNPIFVQVVDGIGVTNALVVANINGPGVTNASLVFLNGGLAPDDFALDGIYSANFKATNIGNYQFEFTASAPGKTNAMQILTYVVRDRPANDKFALPRKINATGELITDEDTALATLESGEPAHGGATNIVGSLWYAWTPLVTGPVLLNTYGTVADTALAVYTGNTLGLLKPVASIVPKPPQKSVALTFNATAGTTYRIAAAGVGDRGNGPIRLQLVPNGTPDTVPPSVAFSGLPNGLIVTTNQLEIVGSAIDSLPSPSGVSAVVVSLNGFAISTTGTDSWKANASLQLGANTISVIVQDFAENKSAPATITVNYRKLPVANDLFAQAQLLTGLTGTVGGNNTTSSSEFNEPVHGGNAGGHSVWWNYTAPFDGVLALTTTNSSFDTLLGVYLGDRVGSLTSIAENDDSLPGSGFSSLTVALKAGNVARIAVDGFAGAVGQIKLAYQFGASKLFTVGVSSEPNGVVSSSGGLYSSNSIVTLTATPDANYIFSGWQGSFSSFKNPLTFPVLNNITLRAKFIPVPVDDDFELGNLSKLSWQTAGAAVWTVQSNVAARGLFSAQAGIIGNSQFTSLILVTNSSGGPGSFAYKVSSEAGWDFLEFRLNDSLLQSWSGEIPWTTYSFTVPLGLNRFEWRYTKDAGLFEGLDTAYLDNVSLSIRPGESNDSAARLSFAGFFDGAPKIKGTGQLNQIYLIQYSNDFLEWTTFSTIINSSGSFEVIDNGASREDARYYRAMVAP